MNSLPSRGFTWNIKSYFLWKTMKNVYECRLLQSWFALWGLRIITVIVNLSALESLQIVLQHMWMAKAKSDGKPSVQISYHCQDKRGAVVERGAGVEWLERLSYGAEGRRKVVSLRLGFAIRRLENSLCQSSSKWLPFSNYGRTRQRKERDGIHLSFAVPRIQSNPSVPMTIRLWEIFTLLPY